MIHRNFAAPSDPDWKEKARIATEAVIRAYEQTPPGTKFKYDWSPWSKVWGELKEHLREVFKGRCAYCEAEYKITGFGDVDHFRPKGRVKGADDHPGYYWLAFDPENLLLACSQCNAGQGKLDQFPIDPASPRVTSHANADALKQEIPLLLNPFVDNPEDHLEFEQGTGMVKVKTGSSKGKTTVKTLNLNRSDLVQDRRKEQERLELKFKSLRLNDDIKEINGWINEIKQGEVKYSAALKAQVVKCLNWFKVIGSLN